MTHKRINGANFPQGIELWVSEPCKSAKTGKTTYWCTIDEWNEGALLYLSHSVWEDLTTVDRDSVFAKLNTGKFEITEATDIATGKTLMTSGDNPEVIYQISKAKDTKHYTFG